MPTFPYDDPVYALTDALHEHWCGEDVFGGTAYEQAQNVIRGLNRRGWALVAVGSASPAVEESAASEELEHHPGMACDLGPRHLGVCKIEGRTL